MPKQRKAAPQGLEHGAELVSDTIFDQLGMGDDPQTGGDEPKKGKDDPKEPSVEVLLAKIEALEANQKRLERTNHALISQPASVVPQSAYQEPTDPRNVDMAGLPDPALDPEGYHKQLSARIVEAVTASTRADQQRLIAAQQENQQLSTQTEALWNEFADTYPDLAEHQDMVELCASTVAQRAMAKGIDVRKYMFTASDQFNEEVAKEMRKRFGKAIEAMSGEEGGDEPAEGGDRPAHLRDMDQANRTGGVPGGQGGRGPAVPANEKGSDMITDLHAIQKKIGLY